MQPTQFTGLGGLPIQSHDLRDPRRAALGQQTLYAQPGAAGQPAAQPGPMQYGAGLVMASLAPQQLGLSLAYSQPPAVQQLANMPLVQPFGATLAPAQPTAIPQQQFVLQPQPGVIQQQQAGLQLQRLAPQQQQQQQPVWNLTSVTPGGHSGPGLQLQHFQPQGAAAPRPMTLAPTASPAAAVLASNTSIRQIMGNQVAAGTQPSQQQQEQRPALAQQPHLQQPPSSNAIPHPAPASAKPPTSVGGTGANATPVGGGGGNAAGPRPMKRQAYQALQGNAAKRQQQQRGGMANRSVGYRPVYAAGDDDDGDGKVPRTAVATRPFPGVVQMLADTQQYLLKIMLYMVKHSQFRPSQHSGRADKQGYDLCKLKADFLNEYKYELDTKAFGFGKVKELVVWLMGDVMDCGVAGMTQSHVVLYPLPTVDYSHYEQLDCNKVLQRVATATELMDKLQGVKLQVEQYKAAVAAAAAAAPAVQPAADGAAPADANAAAPGAPAAVAPGSQAAPAALHGTGALTGGTGQKVPGLTTPLSQEELQQQQQQQGPRQVLLMYLRRRLLPIRVAARRAAVAEAWTEVYMRLDDPAKAQQQQQQQQQGQEQGQQQGETKRQTAGAPGAVVAGSGAAATPTAAAVAGPQDEEDGGLLQRLVEESNGVATAANKLAAVETGAVTEAVKQEPAATAAGALDDDQALLQGLEQDANMNPVPPAVDGTAAAAADNHDTSATPGTPRAGESVGAKPGMKQPAVPGSDMRQPSNAAAASVIAEAILLRQPLQLSELWQGFAAEHAEAAQQLAQVFGGAISPDSFTQLVQELITDEQQPLPATLQPAAEVAGQPGLQQQQRAGSVLRCTADDAADVAFVMQLYEHAAALLFESGVVGELPLYDITPGTRLGLASMISAVYPQLTLEGLHSTGCWSLEQLLQLNSIFERLLVVTEGQGARRVVRLLASARKDLVSLLETRMLQLVGAGLREATACCTLPPLEGYRLDRCKQDFVLEYGYQLQQCHFGCQSLRALLESFPDTTTYKVHQRNTFIMHPSPVFHLRLMIRLLLQPAAAAALAARGPDSSAAAAANGMAAGAAAGDADNDHAAAEHWSKIIGSNTGFSAATGVYPGPPALVASRAAAVETLAAAVQAASATVASMSIDVPVAKLSQLMGLTPAVAEAPAAAGGAAVKVYPPVAVMQIFEAVFGYKLPVHRLGLEHFKKLLLELDGECQLVERHVLLDEPPPNVPGVWLLVPPVQQQQQQQQQGGKKPVDFYHHSIFNESYNKRLAQGRAQPLTGFEPVPASSTAAATYYTGSTGGSSSGGGAGSLIPALGGSAGPGGGTTRAYGSGEYGSSMPGSGRYGAHGTTAVAAGGGYTPRGGGVGGAGGFVGGSLPAGAKVKIMAAVAELLRTKLASVPQAYDAAGNRNHAVPTHMGYNLSDLPRDLLNETGITLNIEGLGYRNLVQLVGSMPDLATIVFSPDRMHKVFPPKPQAGGPGAGGLGVQGSAQPPPPPRPGALNHGGAAGLGLGVTAAGGLALNQNPAGSGVVNPGVLTSGGGGLGSVDGGGGPLGLGLTRGSAGMGGSLGLSTTAGGGFTVPGLAASAIPGILQQPGYAAALQQQQLQLQQQAAAAAAQAQQQQQQQQVMHLQQSAQVVAAVAEAAGALGVAPAAVPTETLSALISAAAAASGQVGNLTPKALAQATAALQAIFAGQAAAAAAKQPTTTPAQQPPASAPFSAAAAAAAGVVGTPTKAAAEHTPPSNTMVLPGLQETTSKTSTALAIPATGAPKPEPGNAAAHQQQAAMPGAAVALSAVQPPMKKEQPVQQQQQQDQQSNPYHQYQQRRQQQTQQQQQLLPQQSAPMSTGSQPPPQQQQQQQYGAYGSTAGSQPKPPPRPTPAAGPAGTPQARPPAGPDGAAAAGPWPAVGAAAATGPYQQQQQQQQQKTNDQYAQWYQQQLQQQAAAAPAAPAPAAAAPPAAAAGQYDHEAYAKYYAEYQRYLQDMAVYQQQMQQYQQYQQQQQQQQGAAGWKPPMPPDPPPAVDAAAKPAAAATPVGTAAPGAYDYSAYQQQAYQQQPGVAAYGQSAAAGGAYAGVPGAPGAVYPPPYGGYPPGFPPAYGA